MAEDVYEKLNDLRQQLVEVRETVERVDRTAEDNRALLEAIANEQGIDVDAVLAEASIEEAERTDDAGANVGSDAGASADASTTTDGGASDGSGSDESNPPLDD